MDFAALRLLNIHFGLFVFSKPCRHVAMSPLSLSPAIIAAIPVAVAIAAAAAAIVAVTVTVTVTVLVPVSGLAPEELGLIS